MDLLPIFYDLDEFCRQEEAWRQQHWLDTPQRQCQRDANLCLSEVRTLVIAFHRSGYRTFKHFYLVYAQRHLRRDFPGLVNYSRFVETEAGGPGASVRLPATPERSCSGSGFLDSTPSVGCHPKRAHSHKVFIVVKGKLFSLISSQRSVRCAHAGSADHLVPCARRTLLI